MTTATFAHDSTDALEVLRSLGRMYCLNGKLALVWARGASFTDGKGIWIDKNPFYFEVLKLSNQVRFRCKRGHTAHEAFHVLYTDFEAYVAYLTDRDLLARFHPEIMRTFGNGAEDGRIELYGTNDYPGTLEWIQLKNGLAFTAVPPPTEPVSALLQGFLSKIKAGFYPPGYEEAWPDWVDLLEGMSPLMEKARIARTTAGCMAVTREMLAMIEPHLPEMQAPAEDPARNEDEMKQGLKGKPTSGNPGSVDPHLKPKKAKPETGEGKPEASKTSTTSTGAESKESGEGSKSKKDAENAGDTDHKNQVGEGEGDKESAESKGDKGESASEDGEKAESETGLGSEAEENASGEAGGDSDDEPNKEHGNPGADESDDESGSEPGSESGASGDEPGEDARESGSGAGAGDQSGDKPDDVAGKGDNETEGESESGGASDDGDPNSEVEGEGEGSSGGSEGEGESEDAGAGETDGSGSDADGKGDGEATSGPDAGGEGNGDTAEADTDGNGADADGGAESESGGEITPGGESEHEHWGASRGHLDEEADTPVDEILKRMTAAAETEESVSMKVDPPAEDEIDDIDYDALSAEIGTGVNDGILLQVVDAVPQHALHERVMSDTEALRDDLERELKPFFAKVNSDVFSGRRSGSLDVSRLWRVGALGDSHVFAKRLTPYDPAVAVSILKDCSGSMSSPMQFGNKQIRKIDAVRYVGAAFSEVLFKLNVAHAVNGFTDTTDVIFKRLLKFGQVTNRETVVDFDAYSSNRDGYCLRVAGAELAARSEPIKILFMLSDGLPASIGYTGQVGVVDTMQARQELQQAGIHVVSFYFGPNHPQALRQEVTMYDHENLIVVNDLDTLASDMAVVLRGIVSRFRM